MQSDLYSPKPLGWAGTRSLSSIAIVVCAMGCASAHDAQDASVDAGGWSDGPAPRWVGGESCFLLTSANEGDSCAGEIHCSGEGPCSTTSIWCEGGRIHADVTTLDGGCELPDGGPGHSSCDGLTPENAGERCTGAWECWPFGLCGGPGAGLEGWHLSCRDGWVVAHDLFSGDCHILEQRSPDLDVELCERCMGARCGTDPECDALFQCYRDAIYIGGCCQDSDCVGISERPYCGPMLICAPEPTE